MKKAILVILPILTLVMEILPYGGVLTFAPSADERVSETFSYFDFMLVGYGNFFPFITAILTCVILLMSVIAVVKGAKAINNALFMISLIASVISFMPVLFLQYSVIGVIITLLLIAECIAAKLILNSKTT